MYQLYCKKYKEEYTMAIINQPFQGQLGNVGLSNICYTDRK